MARAKASRATPGWVWLIAGVAIGLFAAFMVYLNNQGVRVHVSSAGDPKPKPGAENTGTEKPKFEFYTILPDMEVVVNDTPETPRSEIKPPKVVDTTQQTSAIPPQATATPSPLPKVTVDPAAPVTDLSAKSSDATTPPPKSANYVLQLGSFQRGEDAERMKANLALLGMQASVERVAIGSQNWHRVRIGPSKSIKELDEIRGQLKRNRINAVLVKTSASN
jgi:cell division protein FtsN